MKTNDSAEKTIQELVNKKKSLKNEMKFLTNNKIKDYHVSRYIQIIQTENNFPFCEPKQQIYKYTSVNLFSKDWIATEFNKTKWKIV